VKKIQKYKAKLQEAQEVDKKSVQKLVLNQAKTLDGQKKSSLSTGKIANQKGTWSRITKSKAQTELVLKINQPRESRTSAER